MIANFLRLIAVALVLLPALAAAEPIKLKLAFYSSDRTFAYQALVEPFVSAVNAEGKGLVEIEVYFSGALGKAQREQPQLVLDGKADIAFVVPGQNPERFADNVVIQLPGLFQNGREATLVHTRLVQANLLAGYKDFVTIAAVATAPQPIHSRKPIASLADLKGQTLRTNNPTEAVALAKLGAIPVVLAFNETAPAISSGAIDGATAPTAQLSDSGIGRLVSNHYLLGVSAAPLVLLMNRQVFDRLPNEAKAIIRKYSGEWAATRYIEMFEKSDQAAEQAIESDGRRHVVRPSRADQETARLAFKSVVDGWATNSAHNRALLAAAEAELAKLRAQR